MGGASELEIAEEHFGKWCIYRRSFDKYKALIQDNGIRLQLRVIVLWGQAGTGKTRYCYDQFPELYSCPDSSLKWFDGYQGESTVLIDDYRGTADESFLLKLLDIYPLQVPVKGGFAQWRAQTILITSNTIFPFGHIPIEEPFRRRVHKIVRVDMGMSTEDIQAIIDTE